MSQWFWDLLEAAEKNLLVLCRKLEQLPKDLLQQYQVEYDEAMDYVNPSQCEEFAPYLAEDWSEDDGEDFAAWVVSQGRDFYDRLRVQPEVFREYLRMFARRNSRRGSSNAERWDRSVDRPEYEGYQSPESIASPIYELKFGEDLFDACYDRNGKPRREL